MPKTCFKIYPERRVVSIHWAGVPRVEDWYDIIEQILGHPDYRRGMGLLSYLAGSHSAITPTYVRGVLQALEHRSQWMQPLSIAKVAPEASTFGMARMAEMLAETTTVRLRAFRRPREALEWLKAPVPYAHAGFDPPHQRPVVT